MHPGEPVTAAVLRDWPLPRLDDSADKKGRGKVDVVGGAVSTPGAVILAGLAALRVGAGTLHITTVPETCVSVAVTVPEAMVEPQVSAGADAYVVGPGVLDAGDLVARVLKDSGEARLVIDAACLAELPDGLPEGTVLTPNRKELESLGGDPARAARALGAVVLTHGAVAAPDGRLWRDEVGTPALGTSGSGDVLAGVVGGLLARGAEPEQAAVWAQYLHGRAAQRRAPATLGILARDLLDELPLLLADLD